MPNDAKLGWVLGVGIVVAIALVFGRKEADQSTSSAGTEAQVAADSKSVVSSVGPVAGDAVNKTKVADDFGQGQSIGRLTGRRHVVGEGEDIYSVAELYFGDRSKSATILQANPGLQQTAPALKPGTELLIPAVKDPPAGTEDDPPNS